MLAKTQIYVRYVCMLRTHDFLSQVCDQNQIQYQRRITLPNAFFQQRRDFVARCYMCSLIFFLCDCSLLPRSQPRPDRDLIECDKAFAGKDGQRSGFCPRQYGSCFDKDYHFHRQVIYNNPQLFCRARISAEEPREKCW